MFFWRNTMAYLLKCSCGKEVPVQSSQAGLEIACECGQAIKVPSLSKLRELSGKGAYEAGIIDTINRLIGCGELPAGNRCAVSGEPTEDAIELFVEAERISQVGTSVGQAVLVALLCSPLLAAAMAIKDPRDVGREIVVATPLRVSGIHHRRVRKASQRALKRWLRTIPVYAQLLKEYPRSRVVFHAPGELGSFDQSALQKPKDTRDLEFEI
jgi:hypothetical protein